MFGVLQQQGDERCEDIAWDVWQRGRAGEIHDEDVAKGAEICTRKAACDYACNLRGKQVAVWESRKDSREGDHDNFWRNGESDECAEE